MPFPPSKAPTTPGDIGVNTLVTPVATEPSSAEPNDSETLFEAGHAPIATLAEASNPDGSHVPCMSATFPGMSSLNTIGAR